jgi:predicted nuclease of predicted toxin-antitoxin system
VRILLDEFVPWPMRHLLPGHDCISVQKRGWKGTKNGALLQLAASEFNLFVTSDQNMRYQQNLLGSAIAVLELSTNEHPQGSHDDSS